MKKHTYSAAHNTQNNQKKTKLEQYQLFYEEIPLRVEKSDDNSKTGNSDRLVRPSKQIH